MKTSMYAILFAALIYHSNSIHVIQTMSRGYIWFPRGGGLSLTASSKSRGYGKATPNSLTLR